MKKSQMTSKNIRQQTIRIQVFWSSLLSGQNVHWPRLMWPPDESRRQCANGCLIGWSLMALSHNLGHIAPLR